VEDEAIEKPSVAPWIPWGTQSAWKDRVADALKEGKVLRFWLCLRHYCI
jgi:hypothetical protein